MRAIAVLALVALMCFEANATVANVFYYADLSPISDGVPNWAHGDFGGWFRDGEPYPSCSTDAPFAIQIGHQALQSSLTGIVLRLSDQHGEVVLRLAPDDSWVFFSSEQCDVLTVWSEEDAWNQGAVTPIYVVFETSLHPEGAVGGSLVAYYVTPTFDRSWGQIKSRYRPEG